MQAAPPNGLGGGPPGGCTWEALSSGTTLVGCPAGGVMTHPAQQLEEPGDGSVEPGTPPASFDWDRAVYSTPLSEPQQGCGEGAQQSGGGEGPPAELLSAYAEWLGKDTTRPLDIHLLMLLGIVEEASQRSRHVCTRPLGLVLARQASDGD